MYYDSRKACTECFKDRVLREEISERNQLGDCDWCGAKNVCIIPIFELSELFRDVASIYEPAGLRGDPIGCLLQDDWEVFSDRIEDLELMQDITLAILVADLRPKEIYDYPEFDQAYFRRCLGDGVCDDLALLYIGRCYGFDAMLGAFLSDAVDTYDKFLEQCHPGGMDGYLVNQVVSLSYQTCGAPPVEEEELARLINFAAKLNLPTTRLSSSHRRLIQYESGSDQPTLLQHWKFLAGEKLPRIHLGFSREPAEKFYQTAFLRFQAAGLPVPAPQFMGKG